VPKRSSTRFALGRQMGTGNGVAFADAGISNARYGRRFAAKGSIVPPQLRAQIEKLHSHFLATEKPPHPLLKPTRKRNSLVEFIFKTGPFCGEISRISNFL
jgi:hypothetical protein